MKKIFLFLLITLCVLFVSCDGGGGGGDDDNAPVIANIKLYADPADIVETTYYNVGEFFYLTFEAYDEDKDIKSAFILIKNNTTGIVTTPETEMGLPKQDDKHMVYYAPYETTAEDVGTSVIQLYVKDKNGHTSNPLSKTYTVH
jgi:hypothetical protein